MTDVEIGIYTHRWSELQVRAIESIARRTRHHQYSILVTQQPGNCHENMNRIWRRFSARYVVLMDEDVVVLQDGWLDSLIGALRADASVGVVGCNEVKLRPQSVSEPTHATVSYPGWIPAYVMAFERERVPFLAFDENIPGQIGMTDLDACLQIRDRGLQVALHPEVVVYHPIRDDAETRPRQEKLKQWHPEQIAYMRMKWGSLFERMLEQ